MTRYIVRDTETGLETLAESETRDEAMDQLKDLVAEALESYDATRIGYEPPMTWDEGMSLFEIFDTERNAVVWTNDSGWTR